MGEHTIATEDEIDEGGRITAQVEGREITLFRIDDEFYAYTNWCAHQSGPICEGVLTGTRKATVDKDAGTIEISWCREGKILSCPWHGWEYDVVTGECLSKRGVELPAHPVEIRDGEVIITL